MGEKIGRIKKGEGRGGRDRKEKERKKSWDMLGLNPVYWYIYTF